MAVGPLVTVMPSTPSSCLAVSLLRPRMMSTSPFFRAVIWASTLVISRKMMVSMLLDSPQ